MIQHASPILTTLLDTDAYKLHMQQAVFHRYPDVHVVAEFYCRNDDMLGIYADEISWEISRMASLALSDDEFTYLSRLPFFRQDYLNWLRQFRFNPAQVQVTDWQNKLKIRISGPWREVIMWEVPLLALVSEIVHRQRYPHITPDVAVEHLYSRLRKFHTLTSGLDMSRFKLMDFGTRRRFSAKVHHAMVTTLKQHFPWLVGSSNYHLAHQLGLPPVGTQAHEWFQAHQQICPVLANSQCAALQAWLDEYDDQLGIALTDCITMDAFLRDFTPDFAHRYQGLRHDSGDPLAWGEKAIAHYQQLDIDPHSKTLVFSDNIDFEQAASLYRHFGQRVTLMFGIGTRLTCNIPKVQALNIVIKLIECNGKPVAKLSDSPGKTLCHDKAFVRALRKAFAVPQIRQAS